MALDLGVCKVLPVTDDYDRAPDVRLGKGESVIKPVGEVAAGGEYHQLWWLVGANAFFASKEGDILPSLRVRILRADAPGVQIKRRVQRLPNGSTRDVIDFDWSEAINLWRAEGAVRVDLAFRRHGLTPDGLLTVAHERSLQATVALAGQMRRPEVLADIIRDNDVTFQPGSLQLTAARVTREMSHHLEKFREERRWKVTEAIMSNADKWRAAFAEAMRLVSGDEESIELPAAEPVAALENAPVVTKEVPTEKVNKPAPRRGRSQKG